MCGIVGYVGKEKSVKSLIEILSKLEYRGYDSAGYASLENGKINVQKKCGKISNLYDSVDESSKTECFISHTRWATHGKATEQNAHPHLSKNFEFAIVHNGIIENYNELKTEYNLKPESDTDTAVVAELLEFSKVQNVFDFIDVLKKTSGSYAILALKSSSKKQMFLAKQKSPLYLAQNDAGDVLVASDPICFVGFSTDYYSFNDGEFAEINGTKIAFYNTEKREIKKQKKPLDDCFENAEKGSFKHFMLKEIFEQKDAILRQVETYESKQILNKFDDWFMSRFSEVKFIGCGTAYNAGLMGAKFVQKILNKPASAEIASEFIYQEPNFISKKTLYIFVSQSGETADTLLSAELVLKNGATTIALTNVLYSSLAKKCEFVLPILAGVEIAVASTKAYTCMLSGIYLFCEYLNSKNDYKLAIKKLKKLASNITKFNVTELDKIAESLKNTTEAVFIGKDLDYITASEASLKLKEISYINANAYPSGELKHGFLALVEKDTPLFVFSTQKHLFYKTQSSMNEAESRGAKTILFTNLQTENKCNKLKNSIKQQAKSDERNIIFVQEIDELLSQIEAIVPMQYLAYKVSVLKGYNPDKPRNLAKSVTVE